MLGLLSIIDIFFLMELGLLTLDEESVLYGATGLSSLLSSSESPECDLKLESDLNDEELPSSISDFLSPNFDIFYLDLD